MSIAELKSTDRSGFPEPLFELPTHLDLPCNEWEAENYSREFRPLPTHLDLPETDGLPVENTYQHPQSVLLTTTLTPLLDRLNESDEYLIGTSTAIYWMAAKRPFEGCKAPDWYYVPNVPKLLNGEFRKSYVLWEEYSNPVLVVEYVSGNGAEEHDRTPGWGKMWVYEQRIRAAFYAIWDVAKNRLEVFELNGARTRYSAVQPNASGRFTIPQMELELGIWEGSYLGSVARWLRGWDAKGQLLPTPEERAEAETKRARSEKQRAESEKQRADSEKLRADALAAKLRELGIDPDRI